MYFDLNIGQDVKLDGNGFDGYCVTQKYGTDLEWRVPRINTNVSTNVSTSVSTSVFKNILSKNILSTNILSKKIYKKIEVDYKDNLILKNIKKHDVLCVKLKTCEGLEKVIDQEPDLVTFDFDIPQKFKVKHLRMAIKRNVFFEVPLRFKNKLVWLSNIAELLRIARYRNVVFVSGARISSELKQPEDVLNLLSTFGFTRTKALKVLENSYNVLEVCAMKRFCYKNCILNNVGSNEEGSGVYSSLKKDFIIDKFF